ncbi:hypothetical protein AB2B38_001145 [Balneola sp. MJW-20]|uniref:hypothetical protein n=1 Tax=Gracilimonas aurantiaca TaxID=3234185 RepID=UPI0034678B42
MSRSIIPGIIVLILGLFSTSSFAQIKSEDQSHQKIEHYSSTDVFNLKEYKIGSIVEGVDNDFYSGSSFGIPNTIYGAYPVLNNFRYNRVDGLYLGIEKERMKWRADDFLGVEDININGQLGYSFGQSRFQYAVGFDKPIGDTKWLLIGAEYYNTTSTEDYWRTGLNENSITSVIAGYDYMDYFNKEGIGLYGLIKPGKNLELAVSYNDDRYSSIELATRSSLFGYRSTFRLNPVIDDLFNEIELQNVILGITLNPEQRINSRFFSNTFSLRAELSGFSTNTGDFEFNKYMAESKSAIRLDRSTLLRLRLMGGSITGLAPDFKNFALGGIGSMRATGYKQLTGNQMLLSNLELEFGKSSRSENSHGWVDLSDTFIILFMDSGWSSYSDNLLSGNNPFNGINQFRWNDLTHNLGAGIGAGSWRFEVARPIGGAEGQTAFWFRFNPTF